MACLPCEARALSATRALRGTPLASRPAAASGGRASPLRVVAGNEYDNGVFTPLVVVVRNVMGVKPFNQFRGKAISLHSQARARRVHKAVPPLLCACRPGGCAAWGTKASDPHVLRGGPEPQPAPAAAHQPPRQAPGW